MQGKSRQIIVTVLMVLVIGLAIGGGFGYLAFSSQLSDLRHEVQSLRSQLQAQCSTSQSSVAYVTYQIGSNVSISQLYQSVKDSVVVIRGMVTERSIFGTLYGEMQGSGFVYNLTGMMVVITNFHVVEGATNITVTFTDGDAYPAIVLGSDPYADLAVLSIKAGDSEFKPLPIVSSTDLKVGDPVIAIGNPFGLAGSVTTGIISQLGRTITEESSGGYVIADVIQITAPINPGNSGGPLLNCLGQVIGITTATVSGSEGLGFAIPSSTILREVGSLAYTGSYTNHPWLGITGTDMSYDIAKVMSVNVTYGWLVQTVQGDGPAGRAGLLGGSRRVRVAGDYIMLGGDIIISVNGTRVVNGDDLFTYLERNTFPGQTVNLTIVRNGKVTDIPVKLGARPNLSS